MDCNLSILKTKFFLFYEKRIMCIYIYICCCVLYIYRTQQHISTQQHIYIYIYEKRVAWIEGRSFLINLPLIVLSTLTLDC